MKSIQVSFSSRKSEYPIFIGNGILGNIAKLFNLGIYSKIVVVTDENVKKILVKTISNYLPDNTYIITIPSGEKAKTIECTKKIWKELLRIGSDRKSLIINIGGGVVLDLGGFAASTYMRGLDFLNIPTTLLAQVDASIGGKNGIDFSNIKNLIGTFSQPKGVVIDVQMLATLPKREFLSGFAEVLKHGLIKDLNYFEKVTSIHPLELRKEELVDIIKRSCEIKAEIVKIDEKESGSRKLLNFGHTIGHAIEILLLETSAPLLHGEAISIGMLVEAKISHLMNLLSLSDLQRIKQSLINAELPISTTDIEINKVLQKIKSDKKNEKGKVNFTLLQEIGKAVYNQIVPDEVIIQAMKYVTK